MTCRKLPIDGGGIHGFPGAVLEPAATHERTGVRAGIPRRARPDHEAEPIVAPFALDTWRAPITPVPRINSHMGSRHLENARALETASGADRMIKGARLLRTLSFAGLATLGAADDVAAFAIDGSDDVDAFYGFGSCFIQTNVRPDAASRSAAVVLNGPVRSEIAGGAVWTAGNNFSPYAAVTSSLISECLDIPESSVVGLTQNGADGTFESDTYIGFSFTTTQISPLDPAGYPPGTYEFAVRGQDVSVAPTASAGSDRSVAPGATVTLAGSSDADGNITAYAWTQTGGPSVTLSDATSASPSFEAPTLAAGDDPVTLTFSLVVTDADGVTSAADTVAITVEAPDAGPDLAVTQAPIARFMSTRANQLVRHQPELFALLTDDRRPHLSFVATETGGDLDLRLGAGGPVWGRLSASWTEGQARDGHYLFGVVGAHAEVAEDVLVGVMVQVDSLREEDGAATTQGTGWMAGPYVVMRAATQPILVEGRLLYGRTTNEVTPSGGSTSAFGTERLLAQVKVAGEAVRGATTFRPLLGLSHTIDDQDAFVDALGTVIPAQRVTLTELEAGLDVLHDIAMPEGELQLTGGLSAIWSRSRGTGYASTVVPAYDGGRARLELGAVRSFSPTRRLSASLAYDGIGTEGYESVSISFGFEMRF